MVLRISPEQMTAMRRIWVAPRVEQLLEGLGAQVAARIDRLGVERSRRLLTDAIATARQHDLEEPQILRGYAALVVMVGEDLRHERFLPWSAPVLDDPWLTASERLGQLEQLAVEQGLLAP